VFGLETPPLEIIVRGSVVYLALYFLLRVVLKRESGTTGVTDLLVIVLIADAAQNAMADDYRSITDGLILVATIVGWSYLLDFLAYRFPTMRRIIRPHTVPLVKGGKIIQRNIAREMITEEELRSQLRLQGVDDPGDVDRVYIEPDGRFSVLQHKEREHPAPAKKQGL
jgi:uncharacterized membrane protein YcaP (DUF421 family)